MELPRSFEVHSTTLCLFESPIERVRLSQSILLIAPQRFQASLFLAEPALADVACYVADRSGAGDYVTVWPVDDGWQFGTGSPADVLEKIKKGLDGTTENTLFVVDLASVTSELSGPNEALVVADGLRNLAGSYSVALVVLTSSRELPADMQARLISHFSFVYLGYSLARSGFRPASQGDGAGSVMLDVALQRLALSEGSFLSRVFEATRDGDRYKLPDFLNLVDEVIVIMDSSLRITYISPAIERHIARSPESLIGHGLASLTGKNSVATAQRALSRILHRHLRSQSGLDQSDSGRSLLVPISAADASGRDVFFEASVSVYEAGGRVCGYVCVLRRQTWRGNRGAPRGEESDAAPDAQPGGHDSAGPEDEDAPVFDSEYEANLTLRLTPREFEIIQLLLQGMTNINIASQLHIAEVTVKKHLTNIYRKLGVRNRYEVMKLAR